MWFLLATCVCDLMLSVLHYALCVFSLLGHITTPSARSAPYAQWATRATSCCWSKHKQQSIFTILTLFIAFMITDSMDLGSPSLSSQLLICSLLLLQSNCLPEKLIQKIGVLTLADKVWVRLLVLVLPISFAIWFLPMSPEQSRAFPHAEQIYFVCFSSFPSLIYFISMDFLFF